MLSRRYRWWYRAMRWAYLVSRWLRWASRVCDRLSFRCALRAEQLGRVIRGEVSSEP